MRDGIIGRVSLRAGWWQRLSVKGDETMEEKAETFVRRVVRRVPIEEKLLGVGALDFSDIGPVQDM